MPARPLKDGLLFHVLSSFSCNAYNACSCAHNLPSLQACERSKVSHDQRSFTLFLHAHIRDALQQHSLPMLTMSLTDDFVLVHSYYVLLFLTVMMAVIRQAARRTDLINDLNRLQYGPPSRKQFSQVKSPNPPLSRFCLALTVLQCVILAVVFLRPGCYTASDSYQCGITIHSLAVTIFLLALHDDLRWQYRMNSALWTFGRAQPIFAGFVSVSAWTILHAALSCKTISETMGWTMIAQACFWAGYWVEWWTRIVADELEALGC